MESHEIWWNPKWCHAQNCYASHLYHLWQRFFQPATTSKPILPAFVGWIQPTCLPFYTSSAMQVVSLRCVMSLVRKKTAKFPQQFHQRTNKSTKTNQNIPNCAASFLDGDDSMGEVRSFSSQPSLSLPCDPHRVWHAAILELSLYIFRYFDVPIRSLDSDLESSKEDGYLQTGAINSIHMFDFPSVHLLISSEMFTPLPSCSASFWCFPAARQMPHDLKTWAYFSVLEGWFQIRRPLPSFGLGRAAPGITAGVSYWPC